MQEQDLQTTEKPSEKIQKFLPFKGVVRAYKSSDRVVVFYVNKVKL